MPQKLRIGILGCAAIAKKYAISAFKSIDAVESVTIASRDVEKSEQCAKEFGILHAESYNSLLDDKKIDAIYVPLPIGLHEEWVLKAARSGKHILCEKSLSDSWVAAKKMVLACKEQKLVFAENFMCEFHPQHGIVMNHIADGSIGTPRIFKGYFGFPKMNADNFRYQKDLGGGALNDAGAYTIFMARKMFSLEPKTVSANLSINSEGIDMHGSCLMEFDHAKNAILGFSFESVYQNNYSIWGSKGLITCHRAYSIPPNIKPHIELYTNENSKENVLPIDATMANQFELSLSDFCQHVVKKDKKTMDEKYEDILHQARALEAIRRSAKEDQKIKLSDVI